MDIKEIRKIIELMKENDLTSFEIQEEDFRLALKRGPGEEAKMVIPMSAPAPSAPASPPSAPAAAPAEADKVSAQTEDEDDGLIEIKSPIVGTFYRSGSPEADPYVNVGQDVDKDTVVCIIEAMKVMNEIKADVKGVIVKILAENATPVVYGQPLFKVKPE